MKNFLPRYYHWILLGLATLSLLVSAGLLISWSMGLGDTFTALSDAAKVAKSAAPEPSTTSSDALKILKAPIIWDAREDGASPLVSRSYILKDGTLIDPMEGDIPLYPPVPNQWLVEHGLDVSDTHILQSDPKHKGFTVLEEWTWKTDPNNPHEFPPLYTKLSYSDADISKSNYTLEFVDAEENDGKMEFELRPREPIPNPDRGGRPDTSSRTVVKGDTVPGAPFLLVTDYQEKKTTINDTEYDVSELTLQNTLTKESYTLTKKYGNRKYQPTPIELVESVTFHYQLTGVPEDIITVERGKEFTLASLDKKFTETYKLHDFSNGDIVLEKKDGSTFTIKASNSASSPTPSPTP